MSLNYVARVVVGLGVLHSVWASTPPAFSASAPPAERAASDDAVKTVLARPLFAPDRRPDATTAQVESLPVLTGIVHFAGQDGALFRGAGNSAGHLVRQGESVAGWRVVAVARESVTLERGGQQIVQRPDFQHHLDTEMADHSPAPEAAE
ncbi:hypothetical protein [Acetobacter persici]|uniref:Type II secretion system protein GspC N-terminal domain-containing protein n=1 Tax=Acetobacter persici TaxID=1076596 RepID=A0A6V8I6X6_9PROT|nr:hypothetical protein [Acetobacter persici]GFE93378.1 hypothetical protein DmAi_14370 [Acetobacter persici]